MLRCCVCIALRPQCLFLYQALLELEANPEIKASLRELFIMGAKVGGAGWGQGGRAGHRREACLCSLALMNALVCVVCRPACRRLRWAGRRPSSSRSL